VPPSGTPRPAAPKRRLPSQSAVAAGRRVFENVRKFVFYIFSHTTPEVVPFLVFALSGGAIPLPLTVMQIHVGAGVSALGLVVDHYRRHPVKPRLVDLDRRVFLRGATLTAAASVLWLGWEGALQAVTAPGKDRRFSGAHARASHDPSGLPTTSWLNDTIPRIEPGAWSLDVAGRSLTLGDLENMPQDTLSAVLDCTGGWFSEQEWTGVRLDRLLEAAGWRSFVVWSETGYSRRFPVRDLSSTWLVTKVGGEPLSAGHGFPARIVAPARRGFWWVKWVTRIELSPVPWWMQSPFPLT